MFLTSVQNSEKTLWYTSVQGIVKEANTLKHIFMNPKDKIPSWLKQNIVYKWSCLEQNCNLSDIEESRRCLQNRIKENSHITSEIYQHSISNNHLRANIYHFKIIDQDSKKVARDNTLHIRINNPTLNCNTREMYIPEILNNLLWADGSTNAFNQIVDLHLVQGHTHSIVPSNRFARAVCLVN